MPEVDVRSWSEVISKYGFSAIAQFGSYCSEQNILHTPDNFKEYLIGNINGSYIFGRR